MEKSENKSELRVFIKLCQKFVKRPYNPKLELDPLVYMINKHRHEELKILLHCPIERNPEYSFGFACFTRIFKYACRHGCEICVKLILDRSEEKEIDLNSTKEGSWQCGQFEFCECLEYDHCLFVAKRNERFSKDVLDLLLRSAEEKGIDIHTKRPFGGTLRREIIKNFRGEKYTEATYKILKIDPSVDLKRRQ